MTVSLFSQIKITFQACFPSRRLFPAATQCRPLWQREALAFLGSGDELGFYLQDESKKEMNQTQILASEKGLDWPLLVVKDQIQLRWVV